MCRPTKLQVLEARHAGLREKVQTAFNTGWPALAVQQLIEAQYGAHLGLSSVERYKRRHWQAQIALAEDVIGALSRARSQEQGVRRQESGDRSQESGARIQDAGLRI